MAPIRTCIGCRRRRAWSELVRVRVESGPELIIDDRGPGRGAWVCGSVECIEAAAKTRAFSRAFRSKHPDADFADTLLGWLGARTDSESLPILQD